VPLPPVCPPSSKENNASPDDWTPYTNQAQFELAELLYPKAQMSAGNIDQLMKTWAVHGAEHSEEPPFLNHNQEVCKKKILYTGLNFPAKAPPPYYM